MDPSLAEITCLIGVAALLTAAAMVGRHLRPLEDSRWLRIPPAAFLAVVAALVGVLR